MASIPIDKRVIKKFEKLCKAQDMGYAKQKVTLDTRSIGGPPLGPIIYGKNEDELCYEAYKLHYRYLAGVTTINGKLAGTPIANPWPTPPIGDASPIEDATPMLCYMLARHVAAPPPPSDNGAPPSYTSLHQ